MPTTENVSLRGEFYLDLGKNIHFKHAGAESLLDNAWEVMRVINPDMAKKVSDFRLHHAQTPDSPRDNMLYILLDFDDSTDITAAYDLMCECTVPLHRMLRQHFPVKCVTPSVKLVGPPVLFGKYVPPAPLKLVA